jgi:hypothetical protein
LTLMQVIPKESSLMNDYPNRDVQSVPMQDQGRFEDPTLNRIYKNAEKNDPQILDFVRLPISFHLGDIVSYEMSCKNPGLLVIELSSGRRILTEELFDDFSHKFAQMYEQMENNFLEDLPIPKAKPKTRKVKDA